MSKYTQAQLEAVLEQGVDVHGRRIFLHGQIDEGTIGLATRGLYVLNTISATQPVELYVSSYGGSLDDAFALHDVTRTISCPVHTVAIGKCQSAAPLLVACGQRSHRYATENTIFMMHNALIEGLEGSPKLMEIWSAVSSNQMKTYAKLLGKYTKMPARHWQRIFDSELDKFFTAEQAAEWGLVDSLWSEKD